ncbi:DUF6287 domain-containing protein [Streptococcus chenjunshii]|nr:DUF6287 domain-containing protein [Streptococcus chenjunshii]
MKKIVSCFAACLAVLFLLAACAGQKSEENNQTVSEFSSTSQVTTQADADKSQPSSTVGGASEADEKESNPSSEIAAINGLDTGRILKGDYGTMAGNWQNAKGELLTFNHSGLTSSDMTGSFLDIDQDGVLLLNVDKAGKTNLTLYIVPAGKTLSSAYFADGQTDTSDTAKDRIISSEDLAEDSLAEKVYYHISNE